MSEATSFRAIMSLWPSLEEMAAEIDASVFAVRKWWQRDRIPDEWWKAVLAASRVKNANVTADVLVDLAARVPAEVRA